MEKEKQQIKELELKANKILRKKGDLEYRIMLEENLPILKKSIGRCFKYHNSYGGNSEKWWLYLKINSIDEKTMTYTCTEFQRDSRERLEIKWDKKFNFKGEFCFDNYGQGYTEISLPEYNRAKKSILKLAEKLLE